jgi:hypothetical protein
MRGARSTAIRASDYARIVGDAPPVKTPSTRGRGAMTMTEWEAAFRRKPCRIYLGEPDQKCTRCGHAHGKHGALRKRP